MNDTSLLGGYHKRIYFTIGALIMCGLILVGQLVRWQLFNHDYFVDKAEEQSKREVVLDAKRGKIYDRYEHLLAVDTVEYEISASPNIVSNAEVVADRIHKLVDMPRDELIEILSSEDTYVRLAQHAPREVGETLKMWDISGIKVEPKFKRAYPEGELAAHLLGFVNQNSQGFYGIEGYHERLLSGQAGSQVAEQGPYGDIIPLADFDLTLPTAGADLYLTIDRAMQQMVEDELQLAINRYGAERGTIMVLAPETGKILAGAGYPDFNPNDYGNTPEENFANALVSGPYEPGSVFKIFTMAAALDSGIVSPGTTVQDTGSIEVGGQVIYNASRVAYGTVDMTTVLGKSLNVGTTHIAIALGPEKFYNYARRFGFGRLTEVDLYGETPGTLVTSTDEGWYESALATNSFGQGLTATPLQMIVATAAIANDGYLMKPHIVDRIVEHETGREVTIQPKMVRRAVSADTADTLANMLANGMEAEGSAALIPGYRVAGKTGTAEIPIPGGYHPDLTIASFAGFFPVEDPQVAILVILEKPTVSKWGADTAAPTFRRVGERCIGLLDIPPSDVSIAVIPAIQN